MKENFEELNKDEQLRVENEFLKMKLMLESGAQFGGSNEGQLPAEVENTFLKNIIEFEKQFEMHKTIKVFDKLKRPTHFRPVSDILENEFDQAWDELSAFMKKHGVALDICSPNITTKELYRFTIEELFEYEMEDMELPGWTHNFIYDEFHPDPVYDNSSIAADFIRFLFDTEPLKFIYGCGNEEIRINQCQQQKEKELIDLLNQFKSLYDVIELIENDVKDCIIKENICNVTGIYKCMLDHSTELAGNWKIKLHHDEGDNSFWKITEIDIEGLNV